MRRHRRPRPRHHDRRQHDDRDGRGRHRPARHGGPPRRDRDAAGPQGADLGPGRPGPRPHRQAPGPHPDPRAGRLRRQGPARPRRGGGAAGRATPEGAGGRVDRGDVPVQLREPGQRAAGGRDHPRGVPRRRPRLPVPRGHAPGPRVRAGLDHPGERLRGSPHRPLRRQPVSHAAGGRLPGAAADHAVHRRGHAPRARPGPGREPARLRPDGWGHGRGGGRRAGRRARLRRHRHGRHQLRHLPRAGRPPGDQDRLELALPLLHRPADGRRAERRGRRWLHRPGPPGGAPGRAGECGLDPRAGLLRPRGRPADRDRRRCRPRLPADDRLRGRAHGPRRRRGPGCHRPGGGRTAWGST